jgi:hypothetical protein
VAGRDRQTEADLKDSAIEARIAWRRASFKSKLEPVVLFMRADPEPRDRVTVAQTHGAVVVPNPHDTDVVTTLLEPKRRMMRVSLPERVFLSR